MKKKLIYAPNGIEVRKGKRIVKAGKHISQTRLHLCPIGRKDEEKKHYHEDPSLTMFSHSADCGGYGYIFVHFQKQEHDGRIIVYPYAVGVSAMGVGLGWLEDGGLNEEQTKTIGNMVRRLLSQSRMVLKAR